MNRAVSKKTVIRRLLGIGFLGVVFLMPLVWWPPRQVGFALMLYSLMVIVGAVLACCISAAPSRQSFVFLKAAGLASGVFTLFVIYLLIYRTICI
jgi:hypothetical protein